VAASKISKYIKKRKKKNTKKLRRLDQYLKWELTNTIILLKTLHVKSIEISGEGKKRVQCFKKIFKKITLQETKCINYY
jgi:hypothetical protein